MKKKKKLTKLKFLIKSVNNKQLPSKNRALNFKPQTKKQIIINPLPKTLQNKITTNYHS